MADFICYYCGKTFTEEQKDEYERHRLIESFEYQGRIFGIKLPERFEIFKNLPTEITEDLSNYDLIYSADLPYATDSGYSTLYSEVLLDVKELEEIKSKERYLYKGEDRFDYDSWMYICGLYYGKETVKRLKEEIKKFEKLFVDYISDDKEKPWHWQKYLELEQTGSLKRYYIVDDLILFAEYTKEYATKVGVQIRGYKRKG